MLSFDQRQAQRDIRERERRFIQKTRKAFGILLDREIWDRDFPQDASDQFARQAYYEGREVLRIVSATWDEFLGYMRHEYHFSTWAWSPNHSAYEKRRYGGWGNRWYERHGNPAFREGLRYRRQPHHEKKTEENQKTAWREEKQLKRDKAKNGHHWDKAGWYGKRWVAQKNRRHAKQKIRAGRYDEVSRNVKDIMRVWWD